MNRIQKTVAAVLALIITLLGSAGVTAPLAFANVQPIALHQARVVPQPNTTMTTPSLRQV